MTDTINRQVHTLIQNGRHCVLATANNNRPYCSLMAYVAASDGAAVYMVTHRHTRKFGNLTGNPAVSLLIDTRDTPRPRALTLEGTCFEVADLSEKERIYGLFLTDHPYMHAFVNHEDAVLIRIDIAAALYLDGLVDAHHVSFPEKTQ
ncbi:pyridoxamine 5'-phosphate oxidase family protein [Desulfosudis oleivorans]|uniref:Pyridoxamine 5'-phosphate oxidase-related FMN-binding n=1 Tax=Desulfosudis oleivorans (strain DSM 6200 / JCM 39069 / Hxd3) TaxID=96561 RepID=A8ZUB6_DESOH|nr:pyridoxamine 5'-phosphate oxidase family protein [Desulfosudis oleivorans]ABW67948.1 pyridoxamine 5'-phosphate oxidase-related FMN-binding [Desulfosudis oleivorans Hxd3]